MSALLEVLLGPLGWVLGAVVAASGLWLGGKAKQRRERAAEDAREYRDERKEIDDEESGIGATDGERVKQLREIANRRGRGKD